MRMGINIEKWGAIILIGIIAIVVVSVYSENMPSSDGQDININLGSEWQDAWNTTVFDIIENNPNLSWKDLWNTTVEAIIDTYAIEWQDTWNTTVTDLISSYLEDYIWETEQPYSYLIYFNGTHYLAKNGTTSQIDYFSTNATATYEYARDHLSVNRTWIETIQLKGNFIFTHTIRIPSFTALIGFATINVSDNFSGSIIENYNIAGTGDGHGDRFIVLKDLTIFGQNQISGQGIVYDNSYSDEYYPDMELYRGIEIDRVIIRETYGEALYLSNYAGSTAPQNSIRNSQFADADATYDVLLNVTSDSWFSDLSITNMQIQGGGSCLFSNIYFGDGTINLKIASAYNFQFSNCKFDYAQQNAIDLIDVDYVTFCGDTKITRAGRITDNTYPAVRIRTGSTHVGFYGVQFHSYGTSNYPTYCISEESSSDYTIIMGCDFVHFRIKAITVVGTYTIVKDNLGFVTENYVTSTNTTATTFVFNHGLASNATFVFASFDCPSFIETCVWTSTSTQVTITVTGSSLPATMTVYAEVKYAP